MITMPPKKKIPDAAVAEDFISRGMATPAAKTKEKRKLAKGRSQMPVSITMTEDFLARIDNAAADMSMNRSAFVKLAISDYLKKIE